MAVAGGFNAIITNTAFSKLDSKLYFTCMTSPKKAALVITSPQILISNIHQLTLAIVFFRKLNAEPYNNTGYYHK